MKMDLKKIVCKLYELCTQNLERVQRLEATLWHLS